MEYAHPRCLVEWIARRRSLRCEVCSTTYEIHAFSRVPAANGPLHGGRSTFATACVLVARRLWRMTLKSLYCISLYAVPFLLAGTLLPLFCILTSLPFIGGVLFNRVLPLLGISARSVLSTPPEQRPYVLIISFIIGVLQIFICQAGRHMLYLWQEWCAAHGDAVPLPAREARPAGQNAAPHIAEPAAAALPHDGPPAPLVADGGETAPPFVARPRAERVDIFSAATYHEAIAAGSLQGRRADAAVERGLVLSLIDRTMACRRKRKRFWQEPFPRDTLTEARHIVVGWCCVLVCVFVVPAAAELLARPVTQLLTGTLGDLAAVPNSYNNGGGARDGSGSEHRSSTGAALVRLPLVVMHSNWLALLVAKHVAARCGPPAVRRAIALIYPLVRGAALLLDLALLFQVLSLTSTLLLCHEFFTEAGLPTTTMAPSTAWRVLRDNGLAPIRCGSAAVRDRLVPASVSVLRALPFTWSSFAAALPQPVCLDTVDAATCGTRLAALLSATAPPRGGPGSPPWSAHARYAAYCAACVWHARPWADAEVLVALAFPILILAMTTLRSGCLGGTSIGKLYAHRSVWPVVAQLSVARAARVALWLSILIVCATATVGHAAWVVVAAISPNYFPLNLTLLMWPQLDSLQTLYMWLGVLSRLAAHVFEQASRVLQRFFEISDDAAAAPLLRLCAPDVVLSDRLAIAAHLLALMVVSVLVVAAGIGSHLFLVHSGLLHVFCVVLWLLQAGELLFPRRAIVQAAKQFWEAVRSTVTFLRFCFVVRYALGVSIQLPVASVFPSPVAAGPPRPGENLPAAPPPTFALRLDDGAAVDLLQPGLSTLLYGARVVAVIQQDEPHLSIPMLVFLSIKLPHGASSAATATAEEVEELGRRWVSTGRVRVLPLVAVAALFVALPLFIGRTAAAVLLGGPLTTPVTGYVTVPVALWHLWNWLWGAGIAAALFAVEAAVLRTNSANWCLTVLPSAVFHPVAGWWHAAAVPLALRCGALAAARLLSKLMEARHLASLASGAGPRPALTNQMARAAVLLATATPLMYHLRRRVRNWRARTTGGAASADPPPAAPTDDAELETPWRVHLDLQQDLQWGLAQPQPRVPHVVNPADEPLLDAPPMEVDGGRRQWHAYAPGSPMEQRLWRALELQLPGPAARPPPMADRGSPPNEALPNNRGIDLLEEASKRFLRVAVAVHAAVQPAVEHAASIAHQLWAWTRGKIEILLVEDDSVAIAILDTR